jgi:hypothetical protein
MGIARTMAGLIVLLVLAGCGGRGSAPEEAAVDSSSPAAPTAAALLDLARLDSLARWEFPVTEPRACTALDSLPVPGGDTRITRPIRDGERFRCHLSETDSVTVALVVKQVSEDFSTVDGLRVLDEAGATLYLLDSGTAEPPPRGFPFLATVDLDFDGLAELKLLAWWGGTGNTGWDIFRLDPASRRFVRDTVLVRLTDPQALAGTRCLRYGGTGGMAGGLYGISVFCWDGGRLTEVYTANQDRDSAGFFLRRGYARLPGRDSLVLVRLDTVRDSLWR